MAKPKLLLLSDLFGGKNPEWINHYTNALESEFEIQYYDVLQLAHIDVSGLTETDIHYRFLNGGMDKAIETLLQLETEKAIVLGFSIGGTIAWKASLQGLKTTHLFAVSSTRLRYETESPTCDIKVYFGDQDSNRPASDWFMDLNIANIILENYNHQLYQEQSCAVKICDEFFKTFKNNNFIKK